MIENDFNKVLLSAVDEGLIVLGDSSKQAVLFYLQNYYHLTEEEIPSNLTDFKKGLERIFGPGAAYLERIIAERLRHKLGLPADENDDSDLLECVKEAKTQTIQAGEIIVT